MRPMLRLAVTLGLLLPPAMAQDQATTLLASSQRADAVVRATVVAATDPSPDWHRLEFRTDEVLKGQVGAQFVLLEPSGACCGRSLFALQIGESCLLFLQRRGPSLHPLAGARSVLPADAEVLAHVRALLAAGDDAARARLLVSKLQSGHPRVAADAAHALAVLPTLRLGGGERNAVMAAMLAAVQQGTTTAASLVDVAVRLEDPSTLDAMLPAYLDAPRADQATLLRRALGRCSAAGLVDRLGLHLTGDERRQVRAAELLAELPREQSAASLQAMLRTTGNPRVQLCIVENLLGGGAPATSFAGVVPPPVLALAARRLAAARTFRSIDPRRP